jgi:hypothetical protein
MAKTKKKYKSKDEISYPIIEKDGTIINLYQFENYISYLLTKNEYVPEVKLKIFTDGNIIELDTNLLNITNDVNGFNIIKIYSINKKTEKKKEYEIIRKDIFLLNIFNLEFTGIKDYNIVHIDGNNANDSLENLVIINKWNDNIIKPPFRQLNINENEVFNNKNNYFVFDLIIDNEDNLINGTNINDFKILPEYPDLNIYPSGNVINKTNKTQMKIDDKGYYIISYQGKTLRCHQLVAKAFLKNPFNYNFVNHLDGNKSNNNIKNLEWVNNSYNMLHWRSDLNIPFTSKKYREFIFSRIMIEREMDVEFWIFSNRDPFKLFYNVFEVENVNFFSRINDEYKDTTCIDYAQIMYFLNNETINNLTKKEREIKIIKLLERHKFPFSKKDHIFELLKEIGVEFIDYFNWLFDDFKKIVKDEVGFIFFEEFLNYHNIITQSKDIVYNNSILELNKSQNNYYERRGDSSLYEGRMIEKFGHHLRGDQYEKNKLFNWSHQPWSYFDKMPEKINFGYRN